MSATETWTEGAPKCPKCGNEDSDWWDGLGYATSYEWECYCGAALHVEVEQVVNFTTTEKAKDAP